MTIQDRQIDDTTRPVFAVRLIDRRMSQSHHVNGAPFWRCADSQSRCGIPCWTGATPPCGKPASNCWSRVRVNDPRHCRRTCSGDGKCLI